MCSELGMILDDVLVYVCLMSDFVLNCLMVVNVGNWDKIWNWFGESWEWFGFLDFEMCDLMFDMVMIVV